MMTQTPRLIVTPGEPAGIGGEILLKAIEAGATGLITLDDPERLASMAAAMGINLKSAVIEAPQDALNLAPDCLAIMPLSWPEAPQPGQPSDANAGTVIDAVSYTHLTLPTNA